MLGRNSAVPSGSKFHNALPKGSFTAFGGAILRQKTISKAETPHIGRFFM
jgi:hypothetical protein